MQVGPRIRRGYTQGHGTQTDRAGCTPAPIVTIGNKTTEDLGVHEYRNRVFPDSGIFYHFLHV